MNRSLQKRELKEPPPPLRVLPTPTDGDDGKVLESLESVQRPGRNGTENGHADTPQSRRDVLYKGLTEAGWPVDCPRASMYIWARIPEAYRKLGSLEFAKQLLEKAKVCVSPGIGFGDHGDDHVRFALIENEARIRQAVRGIKAMFKADGVLTMHDKNEKPTGKEQQLSPNDDPRHVASRLGYEAWNKARGTKDFNRPLHYQPLGLA